MAVVLLTSLLLAKLSQAAPGPSPEVALSINVLFGQFTLKSNLTIFEAGQNSLLGQVMREWKPLPFFRWGDYLAGHTISNERQIIYFKQIFVERKSIFTKWLFWIVIREEASNYCELYGGYLAQVHQMLDQNRIKYFDLRKVIYIIYLISSLIHSERTSALLSMLSQFW